MSAIIESLTQLFMLGEHVVDHRRAAPVSPALASGVAAKVINAFHSAQPRPRAQVAASTGSAARNACRLAPENRVQAIVTSYAGSPTPELPKSITALRRPFLTSRLLAALIVPGQPVPARRKRIAVWSCA